MAETEERPMWTGKLGDELIAVMVRHGTKPDDRDEMFQICSILMIALLRGELVRGLSLSDLDAAIEQIADLHRRAIRDFDVHGGTIVMPDATIGSAVAVWEDEEDEQTAH